MGELTHASDTWPDGADMDDPSTRGDISFLNWTEEEEDDDDLLPPPPPTGRE